MSYKAKFKNRIIQIPEEKAGEYAKMGYTITKEDGDIVLEPEVTTLEGASILIKKLQNENEELKGKLRVAVQYAENAAREIEMLRNENGELKKAASASGTKKATKSEAKSTAKAEQEG